MEKQIFIINGTAGVGKDAFVDAVEKALENINRSEEHTSELQSR